MDGSDARDARLLVGLEQPDQLTCGPSCLVAARMLLDPGYRPAFGPEVLALHRRLTAWRWPRALGTPPWLVARQLERWTGQRWRVRLVRFGGQNSGLDGQNSQLNDQNSQLNSVLPVYLGSGWVPRHVVLGLGGGVFYNPAGGTVGPLRSRWRTTWFRVEPA